MENLQAKELRIGNWVESANYKKIKREIKDYSVEVIRAGDIHHLETFPNSKSIKPIPLTEEWLLKFGFLHSLRLDDFMFKKGNDCFQIQPYKEGFSNSVLYNDMEIVDRLQHVHQLQNLYFALTGEELTIDEQLKHEQSKE
jgi:hypothetical protein